jgi:hypothetical protein
MLTCSPPPGGVTAVYCSSLYFLNAGSRDCRSSPANALISVGLPQHAISFSPIESPEAPGVPPCSSSERTSNDIGQLQAR